MTTSRRKSKPKPRVDGKHRCETLAPMALSDEEGELALAVLRWEKGYKVGKKVVPARCGPRPILGTLVKCGCRQRKWDPEKEELYWVDQLWRVAPSQLRHRCFICHQWRQAV